MPEPLEPTPSEPYSLFYETVNIGEQLGHLEYRVTEEMLHKYCSTVGYWQSGYVNLAIREFHQVLSNKYGQINLTSCSRNDYYYRPPLINRRVQVSGWIRDKYTSEGIEYLVVSTLAIDDIGTEILKTQETFSVGINPPPYQSISDVESQPLQLLPALEKRVDKHTWNLFKHFNKEFEIGDSVSMTEQETGSLLAFVYAHELLTETYGMNFLKGGLLNVMFCNSLSPDQTCTISAQVNKISEVSERTRTDLNILVRRQDNILAASGKATILIPSPIT
tara:strand:- start:564 stop:1394 length:831 start_codon:yes stop_codon:yes gene_type:complete